MTRTVSDWATGALIAVDWLDSRVGLPEEDEPGAAARTALAGLPHDSLRGVMGMSCRLAGSCAAADPALLAAITRQLERAPDGSVAQAVLHLTVIAATAPAARIRWALDGDAETAGVHAIALARTVFAGFGAPTVRALLTEVRQAILTDPVAAEASS